MDLALIIQIWVYANAISSNTHKKSDKKYGASSEKMAAAYATLQMEELIINLNTSAVLSLVTELQKLP